MRNSKLVGFELGSVTKRLLCISVESTYECKTRGEEKWHCPPRGEADAQTRHPFHAKMISRALSKPCLIATFLLRFLYGRSASAESKNGSTDRPQEGK